jgi:hypothetical protein
VWPLIRHWGNILVLIISLGSVIERLLWWRKLTPVEKRETRLTFFVWPQLCVAIVAALQLSEGH